MVTDQFANTKMGSNTEKSESAVAYEILPFMAKFSRYAFIAPQKAGSQLNNILIMLQQLYLFALQ